MTLKEAYHGLRQALSRPYELREAGNIAEMVMKSVTGMTRTERIIHADVLFTPEQDDLYQRYQQELLHHRPVQYVLGTAHFAGLDLSVNEAVLIPRPETEELVDWIGQSLPQQRGTGKWQVLDIGTGSGCIALALKSKFPELTLMAIDISDAALKIAKRNASDLLLDLDFKQVDILDRVAWHTLPMSDIIVSNPPYIHFEEKAAMSSNVTQYEPHQALFVNHLDVLVFYREIARFASQMLREGGMLFFEINERFGPEIVEMLKSLSFDSIELKQDMQGKERMVKCLFKK